MVKVIWCKAVRSSKGQNMSANLNILFYLLPKGCGSAVWGFEEEGRRTTFLRRAAGSWGLQTRYQLHTGCLLRFCCCVWGWRVKEESMFKLWTFWGICTSTQCKTKLVFHPRMSCRHWLRRQVGLKRCRHQMGSTLVVPRRSRLIPLYFGPVLSHPAGRRRWQMVYNHKNDRMTRVKDSRMFLAWSNEAAALTGPG